MEDKNHRIAFSYYLKNWNYGMQPVERLKSSGERITPMEFRSEMKNHIFCPECVTPLIRTPDEKDIFTNKRTAHFRHKGKFKKIPCSLRVKKPVGLQYETEEEVKQAVQNENLVLVGGWIEDAPENNASDEDDPVFHQTKIYDKDGPETELPLGRHTSTKIPLPSKISSVLAICRNFDENLDKAYFLPDSQYPRYLSDILFDIKKLAKKLPQSPQLFFGTITRYVRLSKRHIIYMSSPNWGDVKVYTWPTHDEKKLINEDSIGRTVIFHGTFKMENENVLQCKIMQWGQYSLLPKMYEEFLPE